MVLSSMKDAFRPLLLFLFCVEGQHLTGVVVLSPDDMCYPFFLLFFIIGGYNDCIS